MLRKKQKYTTFSVPIKKGNENGKTVTCKIKFIDIVRYIASSLSSLADHLVEGLHKGKCKTFKSDLEYMIVNNGALDIQMSRL